MKADPLQKLALPGGWWRAVILLLLVLGIVFRFVNLDQKPYDTDEVRGVMRASGYTSDEFIDLNFTGEITSIAEIQKYQKPNSERKLGDAIKALTGNPEHPPLYYLSIRFWMQALNDTVGARYLSAVLGVLLLPCAYWLCLELFESSLVAWVGAALFAVSPFQMLYAQQARQYSLWVLAILLSSAMLLRSLRTSTVRNWCFYAATLTLGLYTHLFFVWTLITHSLYVVMMAGLPVGKRLNQKLIAYGLAVLAAIVTFIPWIGVFVSSTGRAESTTRWVSSFKTTIGNRLEVWFHNLSVVFLDFNQDNPDFRNPIPYLVAILVGYAVYHLCRYTPRRIWVLVLLMIGVTAVTQVVPDLLSPAGGRRSLLSRYLVPTYVGVQIAVAYLLATQVASRSLKPWQRWSWQGIFAIVMTVGVLSCAVSVQSPAWWTKGSSSINPQVAPFVNQANRPLLISDASHTFILSLSHFLKPDVAVQLFTKENLAQSTDKIALTKAALDQSQPVFLYFPTKDLLQKFTETVSSDLQVRVGESKWFPKRNWLYEVTPAK
jgi:uncharacterized membrane protein